LFLLGPVDLLIQTGLYACSVNARHVNETTKLHKITSDERTKSLLNIATLADDGEMVHMITNDGFAKNAVYHATCMQITYSK